MPEFNPGTDFQQHLEAEDEALRKAQLDAKAKTGVLLNTLVGELLRWPRGDGHAVYMITKERPFTIAHVQIGDAWEIEAALIRGLRMEDARLMVEQDRKIAELFRRKV
jgi:hypothetical protein